ncbi:MAG: chorion class high-cysteine HCB protein 13 [Clostridia bacterium]|nr:chorion class high-cysteine HCB protein 13 [Clostridia bacterium]MBQ1942062.1 chorion class high-cysteine HCB protein 13 [Clostridia bacterium]MBQ5802306.1 chorion class high-cysteine HCB protein 13 [Clostridia bacterium]
MNCFGFGDNCYLWILILILLCCCNGGGTGLVEGIVGNCGCILPIAIALLCCCGGRGTTRGTGGCGCR